MTLVHVLIIIAVSIRIIQVRLPVATSLALQDKYINDSAPVDRHTWQQRPSRERFIENLARLASPLL